MDEQIDFRTENFWARVNFLMAKHKETLKDIASAIDKPYQTLTGWRVNKRLPDLGSALDIAQHFNTTVEFLCDGRRATYQAVVDRVTDGIPLEGEIGDVIRHLKESALDIDDVLRRLEIFKTIELKEKSKSEEIE